MDKQTGKLIARIAENLPEMDTDVMQGWIENPKGLQSFLGGLNPPKPEPAPEPSLDLLVRVDRSVKPSYPDWLKKLMHPELERKGPAEYNLQEVELWLHDSQKNGVVSGNDIYKCLKKTKALGSCLNLQDGLAIQKKGIAVFRKLFSGKAVFLWGSVVQFQGGGLRVPYLCGNGGEVVVRWRWLDLDWIAGDPALRFCK